MQDQQMNVKFDSLKMSIAMLVGHSKPNINLSASKTEIDINNIKPCFIHFDRLDFSDVCR
jgi:hypothetical protein